MYPFSKVSRKTSQKYRSKQFSIKIGFWPKEGKVDNPAKLYFLSNKTSEACCIHKKWLTGFKRCSTTLVPLWLRVKTISVFGWLPRNMINVCRRFRRMSVAFLRTLLSKTRTQLCLRFLVVYCPEISRSTKLITKCYRIIPF